MSSVIWRPRCLGLSVIITPCSNWRLLTASFRLRTARRQFIAPGMNIIRPIPRIMRPALEWNNTYVLLNLVWENHYDVIKWKDLPRYWPFVRGIHRSTVNSPHKGQWRGALMFSLICARINGWVNNGEAGDLRRHRAHCDVIVMDMKAGTLAAAALT